MKQVILDEFCTNSGYNRKYAIRLLNGPPPENEEAATEATTIGELWSGTDTAVSGGLV